MRHGSGPRDAERGTAVFFTSIVIDSSMGSVISDIDLSSKTKEKCPSTNSSDALAVSIPRASQNADPPTAGRASPEAGWPRPTGPTGTYVDENTVYAESPGSILCAMDALASGEGRCRLEEDVQAQLLTQNPPENRGADASDEELGPDRLPVEHEVHVDASVESQHH